MRSRLACAILILIFLLPNLFPKLSGNHSTLQVSYLDVGQGDAISIRAPDGYDILIDGGPDQSVLFELGAVMPFWDHGLDMVILTHPDADHITGLVEVITRYDVGRVLVTGVTHDTPEYIAWERTLDQKNIVVEELNGPKRFFVGDNIELEILYPFDETVFAGPINNSSIVARLTYGKVSFLFTGDIERDVEERLVSSGTELSSDILKVAHHGSRTSSNVEFLRAVGAGVAIIQVGKENGFGHPHFRVLKNLEDVGFEVYRNDLHGRIRVTTDGNEYWIELE